MPEEKENELFAVIDQVFTGSRMRVSCEDGKTRLARVPGGKRRKLSRLRMGDLLIISPWEIQDEKADILFKYRRNQARFLSRRDLLPDEIDVYSS